MNELDYDKLEQRLLTLQEMLTELNALQRNTRWNNYVEMASIADVVYKCNMLITAYKNAVDNKQLLI